MSKIKVQYEIGRKQLYYFYRYVVLPWEIEWQNKKFLLKSGNLGKFCHENNFKIKSYESAAKLEEAIQNSYYADSKDSSGVIYFVRNTSKPKDVVRHLRNTFAHGNFQARQHNKQKCIEIENTYRNTIKAKGIIPLSLLKGLIDNSVTCIVQNNT